MKNVEEVNNLIIQEALAGLSNKEIALKYNYEMAYIQLVLKKLKKQNSTLYNQILFNRSINNLVIDKDFLEKIEKDLKYGLTLVEIAIINNCSVNEIMEVLNVYKNNSSPFYDIAHYKKLKNMIKNNNSKDIQIIFKRLEKLEDSYSLDKVKNNQIVTRYFSYKKAKEVIMIYERYDFAISMTDIAIKSGMTTPFVRGILNLKNQDFICKIIGEKRFREMLIIRKEAIKKFKKDFNNSTVTNQKVLEDKVILDNLYNNFDFWLKFLFSFRLSVNDLAKILNYSGDIELLSNRLYNECRHSYFLKKALVYLWENNSNNPNNLENARNYLALLKKVYENKETEKIDRCLSMIDDRSYKRIIAKNLKWNELTLKEQLIVIKYKIKYAVSYEELPFDKLSIERGCPANLKITLEKINEFNKQYSIDTFARKNKL